MKKSFYNIKSRKLSGIIKIAHLSDLHSEQHGRDNCRLIDDIMAQSPDVIAISGDMFSRRDRDYESTLSLVADLRKIAPVFYSFGNHEYEYLEHHSGTSLDDITKGLTSAGAEVLELSYKDTEIGGTKIRIGGMYGLMIPSEEKLGKIQKSGKLHRYDWEELDRSGQVSRFAMELLDTDSFTLLLSHRFESFLLWDCLKDYKSIDLVLSGHVHGGQVVLPFLGGMYGHIEGLFPKYTRGIFTRENQSVIISAGLGNHFIVPRFNNPRELVFITLSPENE